MLYKVWPLSESECRAKTALVGGRLADKRSHWYDTQRCDLASRSVITRSVGEFRAYCQFHGEILDLTTKVPRSAVPPVSYGISRRDWRQSTGAVIRHPRRPTSYRYLYLYYADERRPSLVGLCLYAREAVCWQCLPSVQYVGVKAAEKKLCITMMAAHSYA